MELMAVAPLVVLVVVWVCRWWSARRERAGMVLSPEGLAAVATRYYARQLAADVLATSYRPVAIEAEKVTARAARWGQL